MEPILDNVELVHHIDMYECPGEQGALITESSTIQLKTFNEHRNFVWLTADYALKAFAEPVPCDAIAL